MNTIFGLIGIISLVIFNIFYINDINQVKELCYLFSIIYSLLFLFKQRNNFFTISFLFLAISLVAITFPVVPYVFFDLEIKDSFIESVYINSLGLITYISFLFLFPVKKTIQVKDEFFLKSYKWNYFFNANKKIFLYTLPGVLLAITASGGWSAFEGLEDSSYDRISSMKGMGILMIFSVLNVYSGGFLTIGQWVKGNKLISLLICIFFITLNGFTYGRGNLIWLFMVIVLLYGLKKGFSIKKISLFFLGGFFIVLAKAIRPSSGASDSMPLQLLFFMQFAGDFDSINNDASLIEYIKSDGFAGLYHIWSNILVYVPRFIFTDKPHDIGALYLDTIVFPGVYLGAEGGTGLAFGFSGLWYAVYGLPTLFIGNALLAYLLSKIDNKLKLWSKTANPNLFFIAYLLLIGQVIILYREGFYAFMNVAFYFSCYMMLYQYFNKNTHLKI